MTSHYPPDAPTGHDEDDGTMPANVDRLGEAVIGRKIVSAVTEPITTTKWGMDFRRGDGLVLTLDDGTRVSLANTDDCCAYTELESFLLHPEKVDHVITGVGTEGGYRTWHIYADGGDVLDLTVEWSSGNPFYYGYGFEIAVNGVGDEPDAGRGEASDVIDALEKEARA